MTFSGITRSASDDDSTDWVGVWSPRPANGDYTSIAPTKYKYVTADASGAGQAELWLVNSRQEVVVAYFTGGLDNPVLRAESKAVKFENVAMAMHLHLALTGEATEMAVDWTSAQDASKNPWVRWGMHPNHLNNTISEVSHAASERAATVIQGTHTLLLPRAHVCVMLVCCGVQVMTMTYTAEEMCGAPATTEGFRPPGYLHSAVIKGLTPNTEYFYQVGDSEPHSESPVQHFWSAPDPKADNVEFVIFGDLGQVETDGSFEPSEMDGSILTTTALTADVAQGVVKLNASAAVFHIGDISYARGYVSIWEQFF